MRIAQVAPPFQSVPPAGYGGTERVVSLLTEELVRRGHEVTLFASGDSSTTAHLVPTVDTALWRAPEECDPLVYWAITAGLAYLLFAEVPSLWTWLGGALIFGASIHIAQREAKLARTQPGAAASPAGPALPRRA